MKASNIIASFVAVAMLAACGSDPEPGEDAGNPANGEAVEVDDAAQELSRVELRPGQYQTSATLVDFSVTGISDDAKAMLRPVLEGDLAPGINFCLTAEEAAQGPERMLQELAEADCTFDTMNVDGNTITADMTCTPKDAPTTRVKMQGTADAEVTSMRMDTVQPQEGGESTMSVDVTARRVGDCG